MIGQFRFVNSPTAETIAIRMLWVDGEPMATIHLPDTVRQLARTSDFEVLTGDEPLRLPVILGYGVSIAALTGHALRLTGDESAWRQEWGSLQRMN